MQRVTGASSTILLLLISTRNERIEYVKKRIGVPPIAQSENAAAGLLIWEASAPTGGTCATAWAVTALIFGKELPTGSSGDRGGDGCDHPPIQPAKRP
jgi:hypothetical protein